VTARAGQEQEVTRLQYDLAVQEMENVVQKNKHEKELVELALVTAKAQIQNLERGLAGDRAGIADILHLLSLLRGQVSFDTRSICMLVGAGFEVKARLQGSPKATVFRIRDVKTPWVFVARVVDVLDKGDRGIAIGEPPSRREVLQVAFDGGSGLHPNGEQLRGAAEGSGGRARLPACGQADVSGPGGAATCAAEFDDVPSAGAAGPFTVTTSRRMCCSWRTGR
jgi:hypothetical protein